MLLLLLVGTWYSIGGQNKYFAGWVALIDKKKVFLLGGWAGGLMGNIVNVCVFFCWAGAAEWLGEWRIWRARRGGGRGRDL